MADDDTLPGWATDHQLYALGLDPHMVRRGYRSPDDGQDEPPHCLEDEDEL